MPIIRTLSDDSPMPFGKYQGTKMANVPAEYLLYIYRRGSFIGNNGRLVKDYIMKNYEVLCKEENR